jgi:hypothetical protein
LKLHDLIGPMLRRLGYGGEDPGIASYPISGPDFRKTLAAAEPNVR